MNIHEYQGKSILESFGVAIQRRKVIDRLEDAVNAAKELNSETGTEWFVVKAQIHAGGRGKGACIETGSHGVVLAKGLDTAFPVKFPQPIPRVKSISSISLLNVINSEENIPVPAKSLAPMATAGVLLVSSSSLILTSKLLSFKDWEPLNALTWLYKKLLMSVYW